MCLNLLFFVHLKVVYILKASEYEVALESTSLVQRSSSGGDAEQTVVVVRLVMRRRSGGASVAGFHLVQTTAMAVVALATFLFHVRNFTDRVMVNLVLIVILTQMGSSANTVDLPD